MMFLKQFLKDLAKLKLPVTAGAVATLFLNVVAPFGWHIDAEAVSAILLAVGAGAAYLDHLFGPSVE